MRRSESPAVCSTKYCTTASRPLSWKRHVGRFKSRSTSAAQQSPSPCQSAACSRSTTCCATVPSAVLRPGGGVEHRAGVARHHDDAVAREVERLDLVARRPDVAVPAKDVPFRCGPGARVAGHAAQERVDLLDAGLESHPRVQGPRLDELVVLGERPTGFQERAREQEIRTESVVPLQRPLEVRGRFLTATEPRGEHRERALDRTEAPVADPIDGAAVADGQQRRVEAGREPVSSDVPTRVGELHHDRHPLGSEDANVVLFEVDRVQDRDRAVSVSGDRGGEGHRRAGHRSVTRLVRETPEEPERLLGLQLLDQDVGSQRLRQHPGVVAVRRVSDRSRHRAESIRLVGAPLHRRSHAAPQGRAPAVQRLADRFGQPLERLDLVVGCPEVAGFDEGDEPEPPTQELQRPVAGPATQLDDLPGGGPAARAMATASRLKASRCSQPASSESATARRASTRALRADGSARPVSDSSSRSSCSRSNGATSKPPGPEPSPSAARARRSDHPAPRASVASR